LHGLGEGLGPTPAYNLGQHLPAPPDRGRGDCHENGLLGRATGPDRARTGTIVVRAKAEAGNPLQVGAPMPGVISTLAVKMGQKVCAGDVLLSIEAMKMETAIHAEADGVVAELTVKPGDQVDAKDLLVRFE